MLADPSDNPNDRLPSVPAKIVPLPSNSLIKPISVSASVKPKPIPRPSRMLSPTLLELANASALARMIQLTTMSGRYIPSALYSVGTNFLSTISRSVTSVAMIRT